MKIKEIRDMSDVQLADEIRRLRRHVYDLRAQSVTEKLESPTLIKQARRDIARCLTVQNERAGAAGGEK
ncbi:MAG: 50S ribosomal protein L29 [Planctomycetes bacterium]|nr:50S ribosomal protein L29 [Planctomycetota bacterium]